MPIDWLLACGVAQATGVLVKPVLEDLAKDVVKDGAKEYVKGCFGKVFKPLRLEAHQKAIGKALKELVEVIDTELQNAGVSKAQTEAWAGDFKQFIRIKGVQEALRQAFNASNSAVDGRLLKQGWEQLSDFSPLPPDFDWDVVAKSFSRKLRTLREEDNDLRAVLQVQSAVETANNTLRALGVQPEFDLDRYREALLERYASLHFDTLDTTGAKYSGVKLWSVFIPQSVRDCQDYFPQHFEIPKEHMRRLFERGEMDARATEIAEEILTERRRAYTDQSPRPVLEVAAESRVERMVILGDPGSGKSSLLQYLALQWAQIEDAGNSQPLPLHAILGDCVWIVAGKTAIDQEKIKGRDSRG